MRVKILLIAMMGLLCGLAWGDETPAAQQLQGFNLNGYTDTGKKAWEINGDKADISDTSIKVTKVNANFYNPKQNTNLTSDTGTIDKTNGDVHLQDDVVITETGAESLTRFPRELRVVG